MIMIMIVIIFYDNNLYNNNNNLKSDNNENNENKNDNKNNNNKNDNNNNNNDNDNNDNDDDDDNNNINNDNDNNRISRIVLWFNWFKKNIKLRMRSVNVFGNYSYLLPFHNIPPYPVSQFDFSVREIKTIPIFVRLTCP